MRVTNFKDFIIACGYKAEVIEDYFAENPLSDGRVECVDTGLETMTGGRLLRLKDLIGEGPFMVTYGDGVGAIDITALAAFHRSVMRGESMKAEETQEFYLEDFRQREQAVDFSNEDARRKCLDKGKDLCTSRGI